MKNLVHLLRVAAIIGLTQIPTAFAHHSASGIDATVTRSAKATLKRFAWSAPHAQIIFAYRDEHGQDVELAISTFAPALLLKQGFTPKDFNRGDELEVFWHPNRNGAPGGILAKLVAADGRVMSGEQIAPGGAAL